MKRRGRGIAGIVAAIVSAIGGSTNPEHADTLQMIALVVLAVLNALPDSDGDGTPDLLEKK